MKYILLRAWLLFQLLIGAILLGLILLTVHPFIWILSGKTILRSQLFKWVDSKAEKIFKPNN